jgi:LacI family transcriptional regulator
MMAMGVLDAVEELGLTCPDDLAIATFDDLPTASAFRPHLTVVALPAYEIGYKGAELLIQRIEGKIEDPTPIRLRLRPELKIRESSLGYKWRDRDAKT